MEEGIRKRKSLKSTSNNELETTYKKVEDFILSGQGSDKIKTDDKIHKTERVNNEIQNRQLYSVNQELEENIARLKKKSSSSTFKKKIRILISSYILTYKSMSLKKIFLFWISIILGIIFLLLSFNTINKKLLIDVPVYGGSWSEGMVGGPGYMNPVLAVSERTKDLNELIYSGLLRKDIDGNLVPDLAEDITESEDGLTYTVKINDKAEFHDGERLTADDVIFTLSKIQDKDINSPLSIKFEGVYTEKIDDMTVAFHLRKPFTYFKEYLTFGVLPKHILQNISAQEFSMTEFNSSPIGSGPYKIKNILKDDNGMIKEIALSSNRGYLHGRPFLDNINIYIYKNDQDLANALNNKIIDATAYLNPIFLSQIKPENISVVSRVLPNVFSLSFNPNKNDILANKDVRVGLSKLIDKQKIINEIFAGKATKKDFFFGESVSSNNETGDISPLVGKNIVISSPNTEQLKQVAEFVANEWRKAGINAEVKLYNISDISDIIKNREFEVILFGSIIEYPVDLYPYWHSSQRNYPGLNITGYTSNYLDKNLDIIKDSTNQEEKIRALEEINQELEDEVPSIPLYSNDLNYLIQKKDMTNIIQNMIPKTLLEKSERFIKISDWYEKSEKVWNFSYKRNLIEKLENLLH